MWDDNFDKHFRDKAREYKPDWDKDALWDNIDDALPQEKKKRRGLFWWCAGCVVLATIGWWTVYSTTDNSSRIAQVQNKEQVLPVLKEKNNTRVLRDKETVAFSPDTAPDNTTNKATKTEEKNRIISGSSTVEKQNSVVSDDLNVSDSRLREISNQTQIPKTISRSKSEFVSFSEKNIEDNSEDNFAQNQPLASPINKLPTIKAQLPEENQMLDLPNSLIKPLKKSSVEVEAFVGIGIANRKLTTPNTVQEILATRQATERPLELLETGLRAKFKNRRGFSIQSGLTYGVLTEEFIYSEADSRTFQVQLDSAYFVDLGEERKYFPGTVDALETTSRSILHYNKHTFVNIPLLLGYARRFGRLEAELNAGLAVNVFYNFSGRVFTSHTELQTNPDNYFNNKLGASVLAEGSLSYALRGGFGLSLAAQYRAQPRSVTDIKATGIAQRYNFVQLRIGLSKTF